MKVLPVVHRSATPRDDYVTRNAWGLREASVCFCVRYVVVVIVVVVVASTAACVDAYTHTKSWRCSSPSNSAVTSDTRPRLPQLRAEPIERTMYRCTSAPGLSIGASV